jgi:molybdate transport system substrate-binding protein
MRRRSTIPAILSLLAMLAAPFPARGEEVVVLAAHSLKEAVEALAGEYGKTHPRARIRPGFGASGTLARQIGAGAPADLFLSAGREWTDRLAADGKIDPDSVAVLAWNALVFVGREGTRASGMKDLPSLSRIAIGSPKSVPAGVYAMQAIGAADVAGALGRKLVTARDVREALLYAERGEVDGAFVYRTDALRSKGVKVLFAVPPGMHGPIEYPAALTKAGAGKADARAFLALLRSDAGRAVFSRLGFGTR